MCSSDLSAARVCGIDDVVLRLKDGHSMIPRAHFGPLPTPRGRVELLDIDRPQFRWMREHGTLHIPDARAAQDYFSGFDYASGFRSYLAAPLRLQGEFMGSLIARRTEVRPFTPAQIKLLETFADQAVIAIENVRLFQELKESLEQQTATSEILGVIASSPTDIQPVLDVVAANAARLCDATDALIRRRADDAVQVVAQFGPIPAPLGHPLTRGIPGSRAILDRQTIHIYDMMAEIDGEYLEARELHRLANSRTVLVTPLLREGAAIGAKIGRAHV